jgi:proton-coupled amino acid transporter
MLHLKACARTNREIILDYLMIGFGTAAAFYTTAQTIKVSLSPTIPGS